MLVAASVCPHPPLLVSAVAAGAAPETAGLRAACLQSVRRLTSHGVCRIEVVGSAPRDQEWDASAGGSLRTFGVQAAFGGEDLLLPEPLTIGAYLLDEVGWPLHLRHYVGVASSRGASACADLGRRLVSGAEPVGLLVIGDGSAKRALTAPGYLDERAAEFDARALAALAKPDAAALLDIDVVLAQQLWVAGRPCWQVLAGAAQASYEDGAELSTAVTYDDAPYGVGYFVLDWTVRRSSGSPGSSGPSLEGGSQRRPEGDAARQ